VGVPRISRRKRQPEKNLPSRSGPLFASKIRFHDSFYNCIAAARVEERLLFPNPPEDRIRKYKYIYIQKYLDLLNIARQSFKKRPRPNRLPNLSFWKPPLEPIVEYLTTDTPPRGRMDVLSDSEPEDLANLTQRDRSDSDEDIIPAHRPRYAQRIESESE
jgi:hypothetical protein